MPGQSTPAHASSTPAGEGRLSWTLLFPCCVKPRGPSKGEHTAGMEGSTWSPHPGFRRSSAPTLLPLPSLPRPLLRTAVPAYLEIPEAHPAVHSRGAELGALGFAASKHGDLARKAKEASESA